MARLTEAEARVYRELADRYAHETGRAEYTAREVIDWAMGRNLLPSSVVDWQEFHMGRFSEAMRTDTRTRHGRKVRVRYCVVGEEETEDGPRQRFLWSDVSAASTAFLIQSLEQRRLAIQVDVNQLREDLEYVNEIIQARGEQPHQMTFNF